jgi:hypothetical protein
MKSSKIVALIVGVIALFPSASFADNVSGNSQEANVGTTTIGNGNVSSITTNQKIINAQKSGGHSTNVAGTSQLINANTTTIGDCNIDVKEINQKYRSRQKTK